MQDKETVMRKIDDLPETLLQEILDFVRFLKIKTSQRTSETALFSETVLRKDWLKPEEDEVWQDFWGSAAWVFRRGSGVVGIIGLQSCQRPSLGLRPPLES